MTSLSAKHQSWLVDRGLTALDALLAGIEKVWARRPVHDDAHCIISDREMAATLSHICQDAAAAHGLLLDARTRRASESAAVYEARIARAKLVQEACGELEFKVLGDRTARNRIEHTDERMAKMMVGEPSAAWSFDLAYCCPNAAPRVSGRPLRFCRSYFYDSDTLVHLDASLNLRLLHEEATALRSAFDRPGGGALGV